MKPMGGAKIPLSDDHWLHRPMNVKSQKNQIYILFLGHFCLLIAMIRCYLCKIRGVEKLLNNVFGHNVEQPSSYLTSIERYVDQSRRLFVRDVA